MVAALLGVLRSGAAYVPLDPDYPQQRLALMIGDARIGLAVTDAATAGRLPLDDAAVLVLDAAELGEAAADPPPARPDDLAYVIYTSGSTGRPKGVEISHRALVNLLVSLGGRCRFSDRSVLLSLTSLSFDMVGLELYAPLLAGGVLVIAGAETARAGERLTETIAKVRPTIMQATPATWQLLLDAGWPGQDGLVALAGGEAMPPELARTLVAGSRSCGTCTARPRPRSGRRPSRSTRPTSAWAGRWPIPRSTCSTRAASPVPPGVPGELYLGGDSVARGYRGRPGLTAERFVPDPQVAGARMYRTGDQARYRRDGRLDFLGRLDTQVKVRGYRIELGDVEAALAAHPQVAQAVVAARDGQLAGYVVAVPGPPPTVEQLRAHLRQRLPGYMIPARFATLGALPLTPNGQDRPQCAARAAGRGDQQRRGLPAARGDRGDGPGRDLAGPARHRPGRPG